MGCSRNAWGTHPKDLWPRFPFIILPRTASPPVCQVSGEGLPFRGRQQSRGSFPGQLPMEMSSCSAAACPGVLQLPGSRSLAGDVGQAGTGGEICAQHRRGHQHSPLTWFGSHREVLGVQGPGAAPKPHWGSPGSHPRSPSGLLHGDPSHPTGPVHGCQQEGGSEDNYHRSSGVRSWPLGLLSPSVLLNDVKSS